MAFKNRKANKKKIIIFTCVVITILLFINVACNTTLLVKDYNVKSRKLSGNVKLVLVTDLHSCGYGENQYQLVNAIKEQKPDVIVFGGDIADDKMPHENTIQVLEAITKEYPCYYVTGNHEIWSGEVDKIKEMFREYQVKVLDGANDTIVLNGQSIQICGVDDPEIGDEAYMEQLQSAGENLDQLKYTILLAHRPEHVDTYQLYPFDLVLSGHAHGGQWRIPGILNGLYAPNQGIFPKYAGGLYSFSKQKMIVSRGLSKESTRVVRIFNRPELVVVNLQPKK